MIDLLREGVGGLEVTDHGRTRTETQSTREKPPAVIARATHLWRRTVARAITAGGFSRVLCVSVRVRP